MEEAKAVLLVEDDLDFAENLRDIFEEHGLRVEIAGTGTEGIRAAQRFHHDLVLLDLRLPDIPGIEVMRQLKRDDPDIEVIVETGYGSLETAVQALEMGAFSYINKPVDPAQLMTLVERAMERGEIRRALWESEENYRTIFESSPESILVMDLDGGLVLANPAASRIYGRSHEELLRMDGRELLGAEVFEEACSCCRGHIRTYDKPLEHTLELTDGTCLDLECTTSCLRLRGSDYVQVMQRDITERKQAQARLEEKLKETFSIIDAIEGLVYVVDMDDYHIMATNAYARGYLGEDAVGQVCHELLRGRGAPCEICANAPRDLTHGAQPVVWELHDEKTGIWYQCINRVITWPDGRPARMVVGIDITARKLAEEDNVSMIRELAKLNEATLEISRHVKLAEIMDVALDVGLALTGMRMGFFGLIEEDGSPGAGRMSGWPDGLSVPPPAAMRYLAAELNNGHDYLLYGPEAPPPDMDWSVMTGIGAPYVLCLPVYAGKRLRGVMALGGVHEPPEPQRARTISTLSGSIVGIALEKADYYADLEQRLRELQNAYARLETLDLMKSNILATVSHELRTPLTLIKGYANTLFEHWESFPAEERLHLEDIVNSRIEKLNGLINNLVLAERLESAGVDPEHNSVDLVTIVDSVIRGLSETEPANRIVRIGDMQVIGHADPEMVEIVISNLVSNALKFSPEGGTVTVDIRETQQRLEVSVTDQGIGIPAEEAEKIFDRFYQVESSANRRFPGIGLGLFIAKQLVRSMRGDIYVESEEGKGSTFTFWMPA